MARRRKRTLNGRPREAGPAPRPLWRLLTAEDLREYPFQVVSIVLILLATLVAPPIGFGVSTVRRVHATAEVTGTVVHVAKHVGRRSTRWVYTYEYRVDGTPCRDSVGVGSTGPHFEIGAPIELFVDPAAPHRSYVSREVARGWLVLTFFFWGVAALLVCLRGVPSGRYLLRPRYAWAFALVFTAGSLIFLPFAMPPERLWILPLDYLAVLAVTTIWLLLRRQQTS